MNARNIKVRKQQGIKDGGRESRDGRIEGARRKGRGRSLRVKLVEGTDHVLCYGCAVVVTDLKETRVPSVRLLTRVAGNTVRRQKKVEESGDEEEGRGSESDGEQERCREEGRHGSDDESMPCCRSRAGL